jgi:3-oxoadipate enol-lactonase
VPGTSPAPVVDGRERVTGTVGGVVYYERTGAGTPIVLCHGLGGNHAIWWRQIDALARAHMVVTWDQRGFGNSVGADDQIGIGVAAEDLVAVLDAAEVDVAHVVGQSMGAFVALRAAVDHRERFLSLTLSTTLAGADPSHTRQLNGAIATRAVRDEHPVLSTAFSRRHPDLGVLYNQISSFGTKPSPQRMLDEMAASTYTDAELASLALPTLVLAAEADPLCPPDVMARTAQRFTRASCVVLAGASHSAYYEAPDVWNRAVLDFADACD